MEELDEAFVLDFKRRSEERWRSARIDRGLYGFQFRPGTRWNPGLADSEIDRFQKELGMEFPREFRLLLRNLNGTDLPTLNVYGNCGEPESERPGVYSFPKDLAIVKGYLERLDSDWSDVVKVLRSEGFELTREMALIPFYVHRFLVGLPNGDPGPVLSIMDTDAIVYSDSLRSFLEDEFCGRTNS